MDAHDARDRQLADRANALYWDSDASVNDIAAELDLSKGSLYGLIRPRAAGLACPECATGLEYPNRTAREKGFVTCPGCGLEEEEILVRSLADDAVPVVPATDDEIRGRRAFWGTVLLATAAGILVARWVRR